MFSPEGKAGTTLGKLCSHIHVVPLLLVNKELSALYVGLQTLSLQPWLLWLFISLCMKQALVSLIRWLTAALEVKEKYIYTFTLKFHLVISVAVSSFTSRFALTEHLL